MLTTEFRHSDTPEKTVAALINVMERALAGLPVKVAFRAYMADGTTQDFVIAPTIEEEDELRARLEAQFANPQ